MSVYRVTENGPKKLRLERVPHSEIGAGEAIEFAPPPSWILRHEVGVHYIVHFTLTEYAGQYGFELENAKASDD